MTRELINTEMTRADNDPQHRAQLCRCEGCKALATAMLPRDRVSKPESPASASKAEGESKSMEEDYDMMDDLIPGLASLASSTSKAGGEEKGRGEDYVVVDHFLRGFHGSNSSASKSRSEGKGKEEEYDVYDNLLRKSEENYYDLERKYEKDCDDLERKSEEEDDDEEDDDDDEEDDDEEDDDVMDHLLRGPDSSASASNSRDKGNGKEKDHDVIGNPKSRGGEIAAIERQIDTLNDRKSELQGTELLVKLEELHKKIQNLVRTVPENIISIKMQALARSGVDSAGEKSRTRTGRPSPDGRSGSSEARSKNQTGGRSSNGGSGSRGRPHFVYRRRQHGDIRASDGGRAPGYGYDHPQHGTNGASVRARAPGHGHPYSGPQGW